MWDELSAEQKERYKQLILAFASLTEAFAQKADDDSDELPAPIINSKYQETVFQKALGASAEDIGNTSYDAALDINKDGKDIKYLIGIKTFGINSGDQKIAQFKANRDEWSALIDTMLSNAKNEHGQTLSKEEIDKNNAELYKELALRLANLRNTRIDSSTANIRGFNTSASDIIESVYHVLMPSKKGDEPKIYVGETSYNKIDEDNITIEGCTSSKNPTNFTFSDGNHRYKYTAADSQLYMSFENKEIVKEQWDVKYVEDAYRFFYDLAEKLYGSQEKAPYITEEHYWSMVNEDGEAELYSGFNSFYALGSKLGIEDRAKAIDRLKDKYSDVVPENILDKVIDRLNDFVLDKAPTAKDKERKAVLRDNICELLKIVNNKEFTDAVLKFLYRPKDELYIPVPNSRSFHKEHPDFFGKNVGTFKKDANGNDTKTLALSKEDRKFNLKFEPSGDVIPAFITQDFGKAIMSWDKQSILGEWILRGVFQLGEYEPLTAKKMKEVGINTIHIYKMSDSDDVHIEFVWRDYKKR